MWGCLREKLQIIREQREVQWGLVLAVGLVCVACNRNNVKNYKEPFFCVFPLGRKKPLCASEWQLSTTLTCAHRQGPCTPIINPILGTFGQLQPKSDL